MGNEVYLEIEQSFGKISLGQGFKDDVRMSERIYNHNEMVLINKNNQL
jgi:hypothetical protein